MDLKGEAKRALLGGLAFHAVDELVWQRVCLFACGVFIRRPCENLQDQDCGEGELKDCASVHLDEETAVAARHHGGDCLGFLFWMMTGGGC
jgi:hypothetical protein